MKPSGKLESDLERSLLESWNTEVLAVYADHLLDRGDPRGALIALDLAPRPDDERWRQERRARLIDWLGPGVDDSGDPGGLADRAGHLVHCGFIHEVRLGHKPADLLDTPLGEVVRGFSTWSAPWAMGPEPEEVIESLEHLVRHPRPWLTRLVIEYVGKKPCDPSLCQALIAATPNLVELYSLGHRLFESFHHPSLQRLYTGRLYQQTPAEVPDTSAETREVVDYGFPGNWLVTDEDDLGVYLEFIELTPECNELYATYGDLVDPHDTLPALLGRFHHAGLVQLDGPVVRLSAAGRSILHGQPPARRAAPSRLPPSDLNNRKWVLWGESRPPGRSRAQDRARPDRSKSDRELLIVGLLRNQVDLLLACLQNFAIDDDCYHAIRHFIEFLADVVDAGEWTDVEYTGDLATLEHALRTLQTYHRLEDYHLSHFSHVGDSTDWSNLGQIITFLDRTQVMGAPAMFRVAWGF